MTLRLQARIDSLETINKESTLEIDRLQGIFDYFELMGDPYFTPREEDVENRRENGILKERVKELESAAFIVQMKHERTVQSLDDQNERLCAENIKIRDESSFFKVHFEYQNTCFKENQKISMIEEFKRTSDNGTIGSGSRPSEVSAFIFQRSRRQNHLQGNSTSGGN
jgi:hypothetical protein